jgi:hypothetical protein
LIRLPRKALALLAGFAVVASACSGSSATLPGTTTGPGSTTAPGASGASGAPATVNANDPSSIISQVISAGPETKSFHLKIAISGTILAAALKSAGDSPLGAITSDLKLDGTAIEGDVDVANAAAHLALTVPAMPVLGNVPITGDFIVKDQVLYYKVDLLGPKYTKSDLGSLTSGLPVAVPTPGGSAMAGVQDQIAQIRDSLDKAGAKATLVGVEQIGGQDAYHINISIPVDLINSEIAAAASAAPAMKIDSASADVWVYKADYRLAKVEIKGASSTLGNIDVTVTVTNYDKPVTITAPPASQIQATAT